MEQQQVAEQPANPFVQLIDQLFDAILCYQVYDEKKSARMELRNQMLRELRTIAESQVDNGKKIQQIKEKLLPLILKLAATGASQGQRIAGDPEKALPQLVLHTLKILHRSGIVDKDRVELAGNQLIASNKITKKRIDKSEANTQDDYHPNFAKKNAVKWIEQLSKHTLKQKQEKVTIDNNATISAHPLLKLLDLIINDSRKEKEINIDEIIKLIDGFSSQGFDFYAYLQAIKDQEKVNILEGLAQTAHLPERTSLILFSHLRLPVKQAESQLSEKNKYFGYFWLSALLLAQGNYKAGAELLVETMRLAYSAEIPIQVDINALDHTYIAAAIVAGHGWQTMIENIKSKVKNYIQNRKLDKDDIHEARVKFAQDKILPLIDTLNLDENKSISERINSAKEKFLGSVIELMMIGYTSWFQKQGIKSSVDSNVMKNTPELVRDILNELVKQLDLMEDDIKMFDTEVLKKSAYLFTKNQGQVSYSQLDGDSKKTCERAVHACLVVVKENREQMSVLARKSNLYVMPKVLELDGKRQSQLPKQEQQTPKESKENKLEKDFSQELEAFNQRFKSIVNDTEKLLEQIRGYSNVLKPFLEESAPDTRQLDINPVKDFGESYTAINKAISALQKDIASFKETNVIKNSLEQLKVLENKIQKLIQPLTGILNSIIDAIELVSRMLSQLKVVPAPLKSQDGSEIAYGYGKAKKEEYGLLANSMSNEFSGDANLQQNLVGVKSTNAKENELSEVDPFFNPQQQHN